MCRLVLTEARNRAPYFVRSRGVIELAGSPWRPVAAPLASGSVVGKVPSGGARPAQHWSQHTTHFFRPGAAQRSDHEFFRRASPVFRRGAPANLLGAPGAGGNRNKWAKSGQKTRGTIYPWRKKRRQPVRVCDHTASRTSPACPATCRPGPRERRGRQGPGGAPRAGQGGADSARGRTHTGETGERGGSTKKGVTGNGRRGAGAGGSRKGGPAPLRRGRLTCGVGVPRGAGNAQRWPCRRVLEGAYGA